MRALDAKFTVDDNALYRHPDIAAMRDVEAADPQEQMARERGVTYVKLDGDIGILGNGAGLVMSTLDVVAQAGGRPANFLDVGGGAQADEIVTALEVMLSDAKVRAVLFNIFGGITRCDEVAQRHPGGARAARRRACRSSCGWTAPTTSRAASCWPTRRRPTCHVERTMLDAARTRRRARRERPPDGDPRHRRHAARRAGHHGPRGPFHTLRNRDYGTQVVAGVTPGKGGQDVDGIPVFDTVAEAVASAAPTPRWCSCRRGSPPTRSTRRSTPASSMVVCITEGIPAHEMLDVYNYLRPRGVTLLGPNCPGALSPGVANVGIIPAQVFAQGRVGLVSRSGTLTYQIGKELAQTSASGNSTIVGIGGDPIVGTLVHRRAAAVRGRRRRPTSS